MKLGERMKLVFRFVVRTWQVGIAHEKLGKVSTWPWVLLEDFGGLPCSTRPLWFAPS